MLMIRPVRKSDLDDLYRLAVKAGQGMTSLPQNHDSLAQRIQISEESFARKEKHADDFFLLVMEDTQKGKVVGCAGVFAQTGARQAFYAYRIMSVAHHSHSLNKQVRSELLYLTNDYTDCSEVGAFFLDPEYRGNGHWLGKSRYFLMGLFPERFSQSVIAELRGYINEDGESPFWDAIGANFFQMSYKEADDLCSVNSNQFITELMPKYPIYTSFLPECARAVIGKPATASQRAKDLLEMEGFHYERVVDIFDAGPIMRAELGWIKTIQSMKTGLAQSQPFTSEAQYQCILCNPSWEHFRVMKTETLTSDIPTCAPAAMQKIGIEPDTECAYLITEKRR